MFQRNYVLTVLARLRVYFDNSFRHAGRGAKEKIGRKAWNLLAENQT